MICNNCGRQIDDTSGFCGYCGAKVEHKVKYSWNFGNDDSEKNVYIDQPEYEADDSVEYEEDGSIKRTALKTVLICIVVLLVAAILGFAAFIISNNIMTKDYEGKSSKEDKIDTNEQQEKPQDKNVSLTCSASSTLANSSGNTYYASNVFDDDKNTCWTEGLDGDGIGEYISVSFSETITIKKLGILSGYTKTKDLYNENSRPKELKVVFHTENGKVQKYLNLNDEYNIEQEFDYDEPIENVESIDFYIQNIYYGAEYRDTCISDIYFYDSGSELIKFVK